MQSQDTELNKSSKHAALTISVRNSSYAKNDPPSWWSSAAVIDDMMNGVYDDVPYSEMTPFERIVQNQINKALSPTDPGSTAAFKALQEWRLGKAPTNISEVQMQLQLLRTLAQSLPEARQVAAEILSDGNFLREVQGSQAIARLKEKSSE